MKRLKKDRRETLRAPTAVPPVEASSTVAMNKRRRPWTRRVHAILGVISAVNLFVLISTGFLLQHGSLLRLDERTLTRRILPSRYRPQDGENGVRADIAVADLHSGRLFGVAGALALDVITLAWLAMLVTGLIMHLSSQLANGSAPNRGAYQEYPEEDS